MSPPENSLRHCERCGAELPPDRETCNACTADPYRSPPLLDEPTRSTFSMATLLGVVTVVTICLGIGVWYPPLGIGLGVLCAPAFIRTGIAMQRRYKQGEATSVGARATFFLGSLGLMTGLALATGVTFYATCWAGFAAGSSVTAAAGVQNYGPLVYGLMTGIAVGILAGLAMSIWLGFKILPIDRKPRNRLPT